MNVLKLILVHINGKIGSISYNFLDNQTSLSEGIDFIAVRYPYYNRDLLQDTLSNEKYSIQMILESMQSQLSIISKTDILKMCLFDALIGNSDRHHSNWGVISRKTILKINNGYIPAESIKMCPLYDNGSSLCSYINEEDIEIIIKDKMRYEAILNTKSKSSIGWNKIRPIRHFELVKYINETYYNETIDFVKLINKNITEDSIKKLLSQYSTDIIGSNMKELLVKFLVDRKNRIINIYNLKSEV